MLMKHFQVSPRYHTNKPGRKAEYLAIAYMLIDLQHKTTLESMTRLTVQVTESMFHIYVMLFYGLTNIREEEGNEFVVHLTNSPCSKLVKYSLLYYYAMMTDF